jgi:hypothetical protein
MQRRDRGKADENPAFSRNPNRLSVRLMSL